MYISLCFVLYLTLLHISEDWTVVHTFL